MCYDPDPVHEEILRVSDLFKAMQFRAEHQTHFKVSHWIIEIIIWKIEEVGKSCEKVVHSFSPWLLRNP